MIRGKVPGWLRNHSLILHDAAETGPPRTHHPHRTNDIRFKKARVSKLLSNMKVGAAWGELQRLQEPHTYVDPTEAENLEKIAKLHPNSSSRDELSSPDSYDGAVPVVDQEHVLQAITRLPARSTNGFGSWTYHLIQLMVRNAPVQDELLVQITRLFNHIYKGNLGFDTARLWSTSRLVLIHKSDGVSVRPIAITDAWYRLMANILNRRFGKQVGERLNPIQLGVGTQDGAPIAARVAQLAYDSKCSILSIDITNAFNSIPRSVVEDGLTKYAPELLPWFRTFYRAPSELRSSHGDKLGTSSTGVRQGDPLGPMLFCVAIQDALKRINQTCSSSNAPIETIAYMDDIFLWTSHRHSNRLATTVFTEFQGILNDIGLTVNVDKCVMLLYGQATSPRSLVPIQREGIKLLGVPIGEKPFRINFLREEMATTKRLMTHLQRVNSSEAFIFLNYCINTVPVFLRRSIDLEECNQLFSSFDEAVTNELFRIVDMDCTSVSEEVKTMVHKIRSLPRRMGGLGLMEHSRGAGDKNLLRARDSMLTFIENNVNMAIPEDYFPRIDLELYGDRNESSDQSKLLERYYSHISESVMGQLSQSSEHKWFLAWFRSNQFKGSGKWLDPLPFYLDGLRLTHMEFICNMRVRLGIPPVTYNMAQPSSRYGVYINPLLLTRSVPSSTCTCRTTLNVDERNPLHSLDCDNNRKLISKRHNLVRNIMANMIRKTGVANQVNLEPTREGRGERPDIAIMVGASTTYVDIGVTNPSSPSNISTNHTDSHIDAANIAMEQAKFTHYNDWNVPVTPFIVEATGRFGPSAIAYLKTITHNMGRSRVLYLHQIQAAIAKCNGEMFCSFARSLRLAWGGVEYYNA
jgi:hypothetical protein